MPRRLLLTFSSAAWLTGVYLLYAHFISPIIEPAQLTARQPQAMAPQTAVEEFQPGAHHAVATEFLTNQDWAKTAENQFKIGDMFLYANTVEQQSGNGPGQQQGQAEVRFKPFALVWKNPKGKPDDPPLRVTADAAAIHFESVIDVGSQQASRPPVWGSLEGAVRIEGPNGLLIVGRRFTFDEQALRLWSDRNPGYATSTWRPWAMLCASPTGNWIEPSPSSQTHSTGRAQRSGLEMPTSHRPTCVDTNATKGVAGEMNLLHSADVLPMIKSHSF